MHNFDYIKELGLDDLYHYCSAAEETQVSDPEMSAFNARRALEYMVRELYVMKGIAVPERTSLFQLIEDETFTSFIGDEKVLKAVHYIRKVGNHGAHAIGVTKRESFFCLLNIYNVVAAILLKLHVVPSVSPFDKRLIPEKPGIHVAPPAEIQVSEEDILVKRADKEAVESVVPVVEMEMADLTEAETRKLYIDLMLKEAGWEVLEKEGLIQPLKACIEIELDGMPNASKKGYADYVLFGGNGKALAVIEAKRTSKEIEIGRQQAKLYADLLEKKYGVRPIIYLSNGFTTNIIDGYYAERRVMGFHSEEELQLLLQRRKRKDIQEIRIDDKISNRYYQKRAIKAICERMNKKQMRSLVVMATGTGKTRTAISLVDVLSKAEWVKNVLFLADRTSLVNQAHKNFSKLLPNTSFCVLNEKDTDKKKRYMEARTMFSTYQTMINHIDGKNKSFGIGRFDLLIVDEAHRSVFGKYGSIFSYFDSLIVGLTATPREDVDKSTYELFDHEEGEPTDEYTLKEAVNDGYLVPFKGVKCNTKFTLEGIRYDERTDDEKQILDKIFEEEALRKALNGKAVQPRDIAVRELYDYIMNLDTIDKVIAHLMKNGQRVNNNETLGKSIIFAANHRHAELIVMRFNKLYPDLASKDYCQLIDNQVKYAQNLIDDFSEGNTNFRIAVSVDMLDVGIDIPEVLNLVFFKPVLSKIKFWQMVGRGTRLCPNVFGEGQKKAFFYIFDWCGNLDRFSVESTEASTTPLSMTQRLFNLKVDISVALQDIHHQEDPFMKEWHDRLKKALHEETCRLNEERIAVREHLAVVTRYKDANSWVALSTDQANLVKEEIAPLLVSVSNDVDALKFDLLMMQIELSALLPEVNARRAVNSVQNIAVTLSKKASIPQVLAKRETIKMVQTTEFWEAQDCQQFEKVREELRDLMKFIKEKGVKYTINIDDSDVEVHEMENGFFPRSYKERVVDYLNAHKDLPVLQKIVKLEKLTQSDFIELERILWEELGTKAEYEKENHVVGGSVAVFIRSIVGIDHQEAIKLFTRFISTENLTARQQEYLKTILDYVSNNGDIDVDVIVNSDPFSNFDWQVFNPHLLQLKEYIEHIHNVVSA